MGKSILSILIILFLLLAFAMFIKLPNSLKTESRITTKNPPERVFAPFSGKLSEILIQNDSKVNKGDLLVKFQTAANYEHIDTLAFWLANEKLNTNSPRSLYDLGPLSVENLQKSYSAFHKTLTTYEFDVLNTDKKNILSLDSLKIQQENLLEEILDWKKKHLIKSPASGKIYLPKKNMEGQFLRGGEFICSIVPNNTDQSEIAKVQFLTKNNAKLIKVGNSAKLHVIVKGIKQEIEAIVEGINPTNLEGQFGFEVILSLPNKLKTNKGETIAFKQGLLISTSIESTKQTLFQKLFK